MEAHGRKLTGPKMTKQFQEFRILEARATPLQGPRSCRETGFDCLLPVKLLKVTPSFFLWQGSPDFTCNTCRFLTNPLDIATLGRHPNGNGGTLFLNPAKIWHRPGASPLIHVPEVSTQRVQPLRAEEAWQGCRPKLSQRQLGAPR